MNLLNLILTYILLYARITSYLKREKIMFERVYQILEALEKARCVSSEELKAGIGVADGSQIKVRMPDGSLKVIQGVTVEKGTDGNNELIISV